MMTEERDTIVLEKYDISKKRGKCSIDPAHLSHYSENGFLLEANFAFLLS